MRAEAARYAVAVRDGLGAVVGPDLRTSVGAGQLNELVARLERSVGPRWVFWSAAAEIAPLIRARVHLTRCWDLAEAHRLLTGGWAADPGAVWCKAFGLDPAGQPQLVTPHLFTMALDPSGAKRAQRPRGPDGADAAQGRDEPPRRFGLETEQGYLSAAAATGTWPTTPERLLEWAGLALRVQQRQQSALRKRHERSVHTAWCESLAAVLCMELERDGLPVDRAALESLITRSAGPRARSSGQEQEIRARRDAAVLGRAPGHESVDLRNPGQVRALLSSAGIQVPDTRAWRLEPYRVSHPLVDALLQWRKDERIATTYGWKWLDRCVGADDRLRGGWTACDGAAGRMTAANGLHNLPAPLRPAIAAHPGHALVRADLGQIEPRVLAAVSGDPALQAATAAADLYAPVAEELGVDRPVAKVAVLAAMYGQRSGPAAAALAGMQRSYPQAMRLLDQAHEAGSRGEPVLTFGGRLVRTAFGEPAGRSPAFEPDVAASPRTSDGAALRGARGRFARNAVIQGAAAELFKSWAATVRAMLTGSPGHEPGGEIVLCLHDELLVHAPTEHADRVATVLRDALVASTRRWTGSDQVRFVADVRVLQRWSQAKDDPS